MQNFLNPYQSTYVVVQELARNEVYTGFSTWNFIDHGVQCAYSKDFNSFSSSKDDMLRTFRCLSASACTLKKTIIQKNFQFFCCMDRKQDAIVVFAYGSKITNTTVLLQTSTNPDLNE
jgi:hypothetical protein